MQTTGNIQNIKNNLFSTLFFIVSFASFTVNLATHAQDAPITTIGIITTASPGNSTIPVTVSNFNNIGKFTLTIKFDTLRVRFVSALNNPAFSGMTITYTPPTTNTQGKLTLNWTGSSNISLPDSSVLTNITFNYVSGSGIIRWAYLSGSTCQYKSWDNGTLLALNDLPRNLFYINGGISNRTAPVTIAPIISNPSPGSLPIPIKVAGFTAIGSMALNLEYDPNVLTYAGSFIKNTAFNSSFLVGNQNGNNGKKLIVIQWYGTAVTLTDSSILCILNFTYNDSGCSSTSLSWYETGPSCEYTSSIGDGLIDLPTNNFYINGMINFSSPPVSVDGVLNYNNEELTPLDNTTVFVKQGTDTITQTSSDLDGSYHFPGLTPGTYTLGGNCNKSWGGSNATDALKILRHFTQLSMLTGINYSAGDVDANGYLNAIDALLIANRFVGFTNSFIAGDWVFEGDTIHALANQNVIANCKVLAMGDVDGSYTPTAKKQASISLINEKEIKYSNGENLQIPICTQQDISLGAISFILDIPQGIENIKAVMLGNPMQQGNLQYNLINHKLFISWFSISPLELKTGDIILTLEVKINNNSSTEEIQISLDGNSSLANQNAEELTDILISSPIIINEKQEFWMGKNYPNPCNSSTEFNYYIPENSIINIRIFNSIGKCIYSQSIDNPEGTYKFTFDANVYPPGIYHCLFEGSAKERTFRGENIIMKIK